MSYRGPSSRSSRESDYDDYHNGHRSTRRDPSHIHHRGPGSPSYSPRERHHPQSNPRAYSHKRLQSEFGDEESVVVHRRVGSSRRSSYRDSDEGYSEGYNDDTISYSSSSSYHSGRQTSSTYRSGRPLPSSRSTTRTSETPPLHVILIHFPRAFQVDFRAVVENFRNKFDNSSSIVGSNGAKTAHVQEIRIVIDESRDEGIIQRIRSRISSDKIALEIEGHELRVECEIRPAVALWIKGFTNKRVLTDLFRDREGVDPMCVSSPARDSDIARIVLLESDINIYSRIVNDGYFIIPAQGPHPQKRCRVYKADPSPLPSMSSGRRGESGSQSDRPNHVPGDRRSQSQDFTASESFSMTELQKRFLRYKDGTFIGKVERNRGVRFEGHQNVNGTTIVTVRGSALDHCQLARYDMNERFRGFTENSSVSFKNHRIVGNALQYFSNILKDYLVSFVVTEHDKKVTLYGSGHDVNQAKSALITSLKSLRGSEEYSMELYKDQLAALNDNFQELSKQFKKKFKGASLRRDDANRKVMIKCSNIREFHKAKNWLIDQLRALKKTTVPIPATADQIVFLEKTGILKKIANDFGVKATKKKNITGAASAVSKAMKEIQKEAQRIIVTDTRIKVSEMTFSFIAKELKDINKKYSEDDVVLNYNNTFKGKGTSTTNLRVGIIGLQQESINLVEEEVNSLADQYTTETVDIGTATSVFKKEELQDLGNEYGVKISSAGKKRYIIAGEKDSVGEVAKAIREGVRDRQHGKENCPIPSETAHNILSSRFRQEVLKIGKSNKCYINITKSYRKGIQVIGKRADRENAISKLRLLIERVLSNMCDKFLYLQTGPASDLKGKVAGIKKKRGVDIRFSADYTVPVCKIEIDGLPDIDVQVRCGDITTCASEAIVNAANQNLAHGAGVAKAISEAAGEELVKECERIQKPVPVGDVVETGGGKLFAKWVIHAVGPTYSTDRSGEYDVLVTTFEKALLKADDLKCASVSLPPISSLNYGFPLDKVVQAFLKAITNLSSARSSQLRHLRRIELVEVYPDRCAEIVNHIQDVVHSRNSGLKYIAAETLSHSTELVETKTAVTESVQDSDDGWFWKNDDKEWAAFSDDHNKYILQKIEQGITAFTMVIENRTYTIDTENKTQTQNDTGYVRSISRRSEIPMEHDAQWFWFDDKRDQNGSVIANYSEKKRYALKTEENIEAAYQRKDRSVSLNQTRHLDDVMAKYEVVFDYESGNHLQRNTSTGFKRPVVREIVQRAPMFHNVTIKKKRKTQKKSKKLDPLDKERDVVRISGYGTESVDGASRDVWNLYERTIITETVSAFSGLSQDEIDKIADQFGVEIEVRADGSSMAIKGREGPVKDAKFELARVAMEKRAPDFEYPAEWEPQEDEVELKPVAKGSLEWQKVESRMRETLPNTIINIERVQNKRMWRDYVFHRDRLDCDDKNERLLFHGTGSNPPHLIYEGSEGFDFRYAQAGMWGRATYFAQNASYSNGYTLKSSPTRQFFLATVALGDCVKLPSNRSLVMPPAKGRTATGVPILYDSVQGYTGGSDVFMVYANSRAYPSYLITYQS